MFELAICPEDRVGIDRHLADDFFYRRQFVTGFEKTEEEGLAHLLFYLDVQRYPRSGLEVKSYQCQCDETIAQ